LISAKDKQITYLQNEVEKSNAFMKEILEDYNRQSIEYIDNFKPIISSINDALQSRKQLLEQPQKKKSKWKF